MIRGRELVSRATRRAFRDASSGVVLRDIDGMWQDEGFAPSGEDNQEQGERRSRFREYEDSVDWADHSHVARALRVFETLLQQLPDDQVITLRARLERDGRTVTDQRWIVPIAGAAAVPSSLAHLTDPSAILDGFDRIARTLPDHPREAIGAAKELIESTAKIVLVQLGEHVDERSDDLPALISRAQKALRLHPSAATAGPDGSDAVKKILGGLTSAAIGVAELRNRGYGTGHGPAATPVGLHPRHAYLAVGAAHTWCQLVLDTLADPRAPWRDGGTAVVQSTAATGS